MEPSSRASISGHRLFGHDAVTATGSASIPMTRETVVTAEEKGAVLKALGQSNEPLVMWRVSRRAGISQQRMEGILPILVHEGIVKRVDSADGVRYTSITKRVAPLEQGGKTLTHTVTMQERQAVLKALDDFENPLVMWKVAVCSKITEQRIEEILPVLMREGLVDRVDAPDAVRYTRTMTPASHTKQQHGKSSNEAGTCRRRRAPDRRIKMPSGPPPSRKPVHNPEHYCPICGAYLNEAIRHTCRTSVLIGIDGANTRALNDEYSWPDVREYCVGYRLEIGYMLLSDDDFPDESEEW